MRDHFYCVYILASISRRLYVGVTNDLARRLQEHRASRPPSFTGRYRVHKLVHFECTGDVESAINREKELKRWTRAKKVALIERHNLAWTDLAPGLGLAEPLPNPCAPRTVSPPCHSERSEESWPAVVVANEPLPALPGFLGRSRYLGMTRAEPLPAPPGFLGRSRSLGMTTGARYFFDQSTSTPHPPGRPLL
jgi:putative endonuclease